MQRYWAPNVLTLPFTMAWRNFLLMQPAVAECVALLTARDIARLCTTSVQHHRAAPDYARAATAAAGPVFCMHVRVGNLQD